MLILIIHIHLYIPPYLLLLVFLYFIIIQLQVMLLILQQIKRQINKMNKYNNDVMNNGSEAVLGIRSNK